jgi:phage repressor protein C with HTH and peptisase S24 domain
MSWQKHVDALSEGKEVSFRPHGNSMKPKIKSGQKVTVSPALDDLQVGDIVFCKVRGNFYVHLLSAIQEKRYQISNNRGHVNGWIGEHKSYGKVIKVEE